MDYPGLDGFLGNRASFMLDVVFLAMFLVVPILAWSVFQVRYRRRYTLHKRVQLSLAGVLLVAVVLFEIDIRINGWRERASESPFYDSNAAVGWVNWSLWIHLVFAISTCILWVFVIVQALRKFQTPPLPNDHSRSHLFWGRLAAADMCLTAVSGWIFYYLAFVAG